MLTDVLAYLHIKLASVLLCNYRGLVKVWFGLEN